MTYWVLKLPYFAQFWPPTHILGNWPKITNIQPILTIPSTPTSLLLPLIYLCELIMNISQEKGRYSRITKIELYWNSKNVLLRIYCTSVFFTWLSNKFNSGMAYNIFKSSNYEKLCVRDYSKMLSALDWHRNRLHCQVFWMPAPTFESLNTFSTTFQILKPTTTNLLLM